MHTIFLDSDIILDVFAKRAPFYIHAARVFTLIEKKDAQAYTSALIFSNIHYVLRRSLSKDAVMHNLQKLRSLVQILPVDAYIIDLALQSDFHDFEDAIQYYTAQNHQIGFLITRNTEDYKTAQGITICTAQEYLVLWQNAHLGVRNEYPDQQQT